LQEWQYCRHRCKKLKTNKFIYVYAERQIQIQFFMLDDLDFKMYYMIDKNINFNVLIQLSSKRDFELIFKLTKVNYLICIKCDWHKKYYLNRVLTLLYIMCCAHDYMCQQMKLPRYFISYYCNFKKSPWKFAPEITWYLILCSLKKK